MQTVVKKELCPYGLVSGAEGQSLRPQRWDVLTCPITYANADWPTNHQPHKKGGAVTKEPQALQQNLISANIWASQTAGADTT